MGKMKNTNQFPSSCQACGQPHKEEDLLQYLTFTICYECNRKLSGLVRQTVYSFIGVPAPVPPGQMRLL